ncbi:dipeptidase [Neobacillus notoginsengisoli]|uniref:Dipeptidase n=1 Tax=Neobacillus notoginsengisoli TaxID=1578198 RepID=A0A417YXF1_9BACI|nr:dipeptidase [Neobacillus notoginsengisoli]RHW42085.1 dipeptidase [Neobacillus notoginsengisoli]
MDQQLRDYLLHNREKQLTELKKFLAIPSISALPSYKVEMRKAAHWTAEMMKDIGLDRVDIFTGKGHPIVYGEWMKAEGKPTVLVYGHYDVQPVDPVELWESPPFEAEIRDNKLYARGASDDKGQVFMHLKAVETILKTRDTLPVNIKFLIEGEEEIGSPTLPSFVEKNKELLKADVLVISDTTLLERGKPAIVYGLRGLCGIQIDVRGAASDLHSGLYGGAVQNPIHALVEILSTMRADNGVITVEGFYDKVRKLTEEERAEFASLGQSEENLKTQLGVPDLHGEEGFTALERMWARPTLEVNGIYGGFQGEGIKTVIPSEAHAKITCRLVPDQDPQEIADLLEEHVKKAAPAGVTVSVSQFDKGAPFITPFDHPAIQTAGQAYEEVYGVPTAYVRGGGSIPIVAAFSEILSIPVVMMGFGLSNENFHAPNEHFNLENFDKGLEVIIRYLFKLSNGL